MRKMSIANKLIIAVSIEKDISNAYHNARGDFYERISRAAI